MEATRQAVMPMRRHRSAGRMSLTPLIDVVFILLVFFMLETNFLRPRAIEFAHAAGDSSGASDDPIIAVELQANGSIWLNGAASSMDGLRSYVSRISEPAKSRVLLAVDPEVVLQEAVNVMDVFNTHGLTNIALSAARTFE